MHRILSSAYKSTVIREKAAKPVPTPIPIKRKGFSPALPFKDTNRAATSSSPPTTRQDVPKTSPGIANSDKDVNSSMTTGRLTLRSRTGTSSVFCLRFYIRAREWILPWVIVPNVFGVVRDAFGQLTAILARDETQSHIDACAHTRRGDEPAVAHPTGMADPIDLRTHAFHPRERALVRRRPAPIQQTGTGQQRGAGAHGKAESRTAHKAMQHRKKTFVGDQRPGARSTWYQHHIGVVRSTNLLGLDRHVF